MRDDIVHHVISPKRIESCYLWSRLGETTTSVRIRALRQYVMAPQQLQRASHCSLTVEQNCQVVHPERMITMKQLDAPAHWSSVVGTSGAERPPRYVYK